MQAGPWLRTAKYAPILGLTCLFLAAFAFSLTDAVTQRHVAITALGAGGTLSLGGLSILRDPRRAARYDTVLTAVERDTRPTRAAVTVMVASGLAFALGGLLLAATALRHV